MMDTTSAFRKPIPTAEEVDKMLSDWGIDPHKMLQCPVCAEVCGNMRLVISHLNDSGFTAYPVNLGLSPQKNHNWSFKQIGKWLEELGY